MLEDIKEIGGIFAIMILAIIIVVALVFALVAIPTYYSSCRQAKIINQKYNTEYTCGDMFWAGEQINKEVQTIKIEGLK